MTDAFNFNDLNLDFLDSTPPKLESPLQIIQQSKPITQEPQFINSSLKSKVGLARRIAHTDLLVQKIQQLENERMQLQQQLKEIQISANEIQSLYKDEKEKRVFLENSSVQLRKKCEELDSTLSIKTLHYDQLQAYVDENKGPLSYSELAVCYIKLARKIQDDHTLYHTEVSLVEQMSNYCQEKNIHVPVKVIPKKRVRIYKTEKSVQCELLESEPVRKPEKETCSQGVQCAIVTRTHTQGTQYISSTTTRSTTTECFIKKRSIGTIFPEPTPLPPLDDMLNELLQWDIRSPVSPIADPPILLQRTEIQIPAINNSQKNVGTCTILCNIQRQIDYLPQIMNNIKSSNSRPPSRLMCQNIKNETNTPPSMTVNENSCSSAAINRNSFFQVPTLSDLPLTAFEELWQIFGQMLLGLLKTRSPIGTSPVLHNRLGDTSNQQEFHNWLRSLFESTHEEHNQHELVSAFASENAIPNEYDESNVQNSVEDNANTHEGDNFTNIPEQRSVVTSPIQFSSTINESNVEMNDINDEMQFIYLPPESAKIKSDIKSLPSVSCKNDRELLADLEKSKHTPIASKKQSKSTTRKDKRKKKKKTRKHDLVSVLKNQPEMASDENEETAVDFLIKLNEFDNNENHIKLSKCLVQDHLVDRHDENIDADAEAQDLHVIDKKYKWNREEKCENNMEIQENELKGDTLVAESQCTGQINSEYNTINQNELIPEAKHGNESLKFDVVQMKTYINRKNKMSTPNNELEIDEKCTSDLEVSLNEIQKEEIIDTLALVDNNLSVESNEIHLPSTLHEDTLNNNLKISLPFNEVLADATDLHISSENESPNNSIADHNYACESSQSPNQPKKRGRKRKSEMINIQPELLPCKRSERLLAKKQCTTTVLSVELGKYTRKQNVRSPRKTKQQVGNFQEIQQNETVQTKFNCDIKDVNDKESDVGDSVRVSTNLTKSHIDAHFKSFVEQHKKLLNTKSLRDNSVNMISENASAETINDFAPVEYVNNTSALYNSSTQIEESPEDISLQLDTAKYDSPQSPPPSSYDDTTPIIIPPDLHEKYYQNSSITLLPHLINTYSINEFKIIYKSKPNESQQKKGIQQKLTEYFKMYLVKSTSPTAPNLEHSEMEALALVSNMRQITNDYQHFITTIIEQIKEIPIPEASTSSSNQPSTQHQQILPLIRHLQYIYSEFAHDLLVKVESTLFSCASSNALPLDACINLTQLYLTVVGAQLFHMAKNPARLFIAKCIYYHQLKAIPMIYEVLCRYPTTLPHREDRTYNRSDPLITVIQHSLMCTTYDMNNQELRGKELLSKLRFEYHFEPFKPDRTEVLANLIEKLKLGSSANLSYAFAILCKRMHPMKVTTDVLQQHFIPLANEYFQYITKSNTYDERVAILLECISMIVKPFPVETDVSTYMVLFSRFLCIDNRPIIQEAAVQAILRLQRFGYINCFNALLEFQPIYELHPRTKAMLRTFIYRKPLKFLKELKKQSIV